MSNYYAEAIEVLSKTNVDFRALVFLIATTNPKSVAKAGQMLDPSFDWRKECRQLMIHSTKIEAIKKCREMTGKSLIDAKEACEALILP